MEHVVSGLVKRRAELVTEAKAAEVTLERLLADIDHIDGALRVYDPAYRPSRVGISRAKRTDLARTGLDVLRQAAAPMSLREVTLAIMARHGKESPDSRAVEAQMNKVRSALLGQMKNGTVRRSQGPGQFVLWEVIR